MVLPARVYHLAAFLRAEWGKPAKGLEGHFQQQIILVTIGARDPFTSK